MKTLTEADTMTIINALKIARQLLHDNKIVELKDSEVFESLTRERINKVINLLIIEDRIK